MRKTELYRLNQWDPDDRIRREDFNADNAAVEAALKALSATSVPDPLYIFNESDVTASWSNPISEITDWSKWNYVIGVIRLQRITLLNANSKQTYYVMTRDRNSSAFSKGTVSMNRVPHCNWGIFLLMVNHDPDRQLQGFFVSPTYLHRFTSVCTYREFGDKMELAVFQDDPDAKMSTVYWVYGIE